MDDIDIPGVSNCAVHIDRDSVDICSRCGHPVCPDCLVILDGTDLCRPCLPARDLELKDTEDMALQTLQEKKAALDRAERLGTAIPCDIAARQRLQSEWEQAEHRIRTVGEIREQIRKLLG